MLRYLQHTCDHVRGLLLILHSLQGVKPVPLRRLGYFFTLWIRPRFRITSILTLVLWEALNHVPSLIATESDISALSTLSSVSTTTLSIVLFGRCISPPFPFCGSGMPPLVRAPQRRQNYLCFLHCQDLPNHEA